MYESTVSDTDLSDFHDEEDEEQMKEYERNECMEEMVRFLDHMYDYTMVWEPMYDLYHMDLDKLYNVFTFCDVFQMRPREYDIVSRWYAFHSTREETSLMDMLCTMCEICHTRVNPWTLGNALQYCRI